MANTHKRIIEKYWKAANDRDWETFESLLHEDVVYEIPQTRERIRGRVAFREFNAAYPVHVLAVGEPTLLDGK